MVKRTGVVRLVAGMTLLVSTLLVSPSLVNGVLGAGVSAPAAGHSPLASPHHQNGPNQSYGTASSLDWAGYAVTGSTPFSKVEGSWTQPQVTCPSKTTQQLSAFWVGIDGLSAKDGTIEQIGTDSDCSGGAPDYYAWFQMYPKAVVFLPTSQYPVSAGETISAEISGSGKNFALQIEGLAGGLVLWHYSTYATTTTAAQESSAEWIAEVPCSTSKCIIGPLADFGSVAFTNATANGSAISSSAFKSTELTMTTKSKITKARPSALTAGGTAFKVTWEHN
jgi:hypothetical protein